MRLLKAVRAISVEVVEVEAESRVGACGAASGDGVVVLPAQADEVDTTTRTLVDGAKN